MLELGASERSGPAPTSGLVARLQPALGEEAKPSEPLPAPLMQDDLPPVQNAAAPDMSPAPALAAAAPDERSRPAEAPPPEAGGLGLDVPVPHDLTYYPVGALDAPPRPLGGSDPCYPEGAAGEIAYILSINEAGSVDQATIADGRLDERVAAAALQGCRSLKFEPGMKDGRAVRSRVRFVVGPTAP
jgi:hypothetical protein